MSIPGLNHSTFKFPDFCSTGAAVMVAVCVVTELGAVICFSFDTYVHKCYSDGLAPCLVSTTWLAPEVLVIVEWCTAPVEGEDECASWVVNVTSEEINDAFTSTGCFDATEIWVECVGSFTCFNADP